jgi:hypothetical protein
MANGLGSPEDPRAVAVFSETSTRRDVVRRMHPLLSILEGQAVARQPEQMGCKEAFLYPVQVCARRRDLQSRRSTGMLHLHSGQVLARESAAL